MWMVLEVQRQTLQWLLGDKEAVRQASKKALATSDRSKDPMVFAREPRLTGRCMPRQKSI
jgi:hypothetical protein